MDATIKFAQKRLPTIYKNAVQRMPRGKKVILFWNVNRMSHIQKILFEESVNNVLSGARQAVFKEEVGEIIHLAVNPMILSDSTVNYIASRWNPEGENIRIEYR